MAGCGNHGCWVAKPRGQGTNGRCNCLRDLGKENEHLIKRKLAELERLRAVLALIADDETDYPRKIAKDALAQSAERGEG